LAEVAAVQRCAAGEAMLGVFARRDERCVRGPCVNCVRRCVHKLRMRRAMVQSVLGEVACRSVGWSLQRCTWMISSARSLYHTTLRP
jgi:hypothetical protein